MKKIMLLLAVSTMMLGPPGMASEKTRATQTEKSLLNEEMIACLAQPVPIVMAFTGHCDLTDMYLVDASIFMDRPEKAFPELSNEAPVLAGNLESSDKPDDAWLQIKLRAKYNHSNGRTSERCCKITSSGFITRIRGHGLLFYKKS